MLKTVPEATGPALPAGVMPVVIGPADLITRDFLPGVRTGGRAARAAQPPGDVSFHRHVTFRFTAM
jgi:hypothetical protein